MGVAYSSKGNVAGGDFPVLMLEFGDSHELNTARPKMILVHDRAQRMLFVAA